MLRPPISDVAGLATVADEPRAIAFLTVPWSVPERVARTVFLSAAERLASPLSPVRVPCYFIDEDAEPCLSWLASLAVPGLGSCPRGAGSVLWLVEGRVVSSAIEGRSLTPEEIVERAGALWHPDTQQRDPADPQSRVD